MVTGAPSTWAAPPGLSCDLGEGGGLHSLCPHRRDRIPILPLNEHRSFSISARTHITKLEKTLPRSIRPVCDTRSTSVYFLLQIQTYTFKLFLELEVQSWVSRYHPMPWFLYRSFHVYSPGTVRPGTHSSWLSCARHCSKGFVQPSIRSPEIALIMGCQRQCQLT